MSIPQQPAILGGINVPAEAALMVRRFGADAGQHMARWLDEYRAGDPMRDIVEAVGEEVKRQLAEA